MKIIFFAGSLRQTSFNKILSKSALNYAKSKGIECEFLDLKDYDAPLYDGDLETSNDIPAGILALHEKLKNSSAWAVSYTHLDVYKRQGLHQIVVKLWPSEKA